MQGVQVELALSVDSGEVVLLKLQLPAGATLADALAAGGTGDSSGQAVGIWGRQQPPTTVLRDGDRIELYRPLRCDPKEARRQRMQRHAGSG